MPTLSLSRRQALVFSAGSLGISRILSGLDHSEPAPRFSAKTLAGEALNNQSLMGKAVLIQFGPPGVLTAAGTPSHSNS